jgi:acyl carrier protein
MTNEEKLSELKARLEKELSKKLPPEADLDLDSMEVMSLCMAVEQIAGVEIGFGDVRAMETYGELELYVSEKMK